MVDAHQESVQRDAKQDGVVEVLVLGDFEHRATALVFWTDIETFWVDSDYK